jgi:peptidoglycan/xylan/chitin deacetylase (PgdA/CDA1 family)
VRRLKQVPDSERRQVLGRLRSQVPRPLRQPQLRSDELTLLLEAGVAVGNHTSTHPCLDRCADEVVREEVRTAHDVLTRALGQAPTTFAYPNGNWDPRAEEELGRLGYEAAFLFDHRLARVPAEHPLRISRLRVGSTTTPDRFRIILSGLHPAVMHARGRG